MSSKPLKEKIPYRRTVWVTGFLKTTISTSLISTGVVLLFNGITEHPLFNEWNEIAIIVGAIMILLAIIVVVLIDQWKDKKKKEELDIINKHIDERAIEIAEEKILEAMNNIKE
ncbi:hypothetical protein [uncultured Methanobrevibacter sp.]|uniref:hypothetical protein n=1 Tax=uncultured Methanobrevibacter sp. TaxID=253161 RepID=UPI0025FAAE1F|nr:hypothetical protein [uncultured Methanobrevibacter sp.]